MVKVYTIWAAYLKYGSIMKCVMLDDHLKEMAKQKVKSSGVKVKENETGYLMKGEKR